MISPDGDRVITSDAAVCSVMRLGDGNGVYMGEEPGSMGEEQGSSGGRVIASGAAGVGGITGKGGGRFVLFFGGGG